MIYEDCLKNDNYTTMIITNYTSHNITLWGKCSATPLYSNGVAYVEIEKEIIGSCMNLLVYKKIYGEVRGLPPKNEHDGVKEYYVVTREVAEALKGKRDDLLIMNDIVYSRRGHIIGCKSFIKL